jgi:hypothetical protein
LCWDSKSWFLGSGQRLYALPSHVFTKEHWNDGLMEYWKRSFELNCWSLLKEIDFLSNMHSEDFVFSIFHYSNIPVFPQRDIYEHPPFRVNPKPCPHDWDF